MIYTFKNHASKARTVVVEHPYRGEDWKLLEPKEATEHTAQYNRFDVSVPAGASKSITVREEHPIETTYYLTNTSDETVLAFSKDGEASDAVKAALKEVVARRRHVAEIQAEIDNRNNQINAISTGQQRIRDNMKALDHTSALYKRYVSELDSQETKLDTLRTELDTLQQQHDQAQNDLNNYIAHLTIS
jgi:septation ring formation regulator EzrA